MTSLHVVGSIHWRPSPEDPFEDLEIDLDQKPPAELDQTLDEYAAEQLLLSVRAADPSINA